MENIFDINYLNPNLLEHCEHLVTHDLETPHVVLDEMANLDYFDFWLHDFLHPEQRPSENLGLYVCMPAGGLPKINSHTNIQLDLDELDQLDMIKSEPRKNKYHFKKFREAYQSVVRDVVMTPHATSIFRSWKPIIFEPTKPLFDLLDQNICHVMTFLSKISHTPKIKSTIDHSMAELNRHRMQRFLSWDWNLTVSYPKLKRKTIVMSIGIDYWIKQLFTSLDSNEDENLIDILNQIELSLNPSTREWMNYGDTCFHLACFSLRIEYVFIMILFHMKSNSDPTNLIQYLLDKIKSCHKQLTPTIHNLYLDYLFELLVRDKFENFNKLAVIMKFLNLNYYYGYVYLNYRIGTNAHIFMEMINDFCLGKKFQTAINIWSHVIQIYGINLDQLLPEYIYTNYLYAIMIYPQCDLDGALSAIYEAWHKKDLDMILYWLVYVIYHYIDKMDELINNYVHPETCDYYIILHYIARCYDPTRPTFKVLADHFYHLGNMELAFRCSDVVGIQWIDMGHHFYAEENFLLALNCYLLANDLRCVFDKLQDLMIQQKYLPALVYLGQLVNDNTVLSTSTLMRISDIMLDHAKINVEFRSDLKYFLAKNLIKASIINSESWFHIYFCEVLIMEPPFDLKPIIGAYSYITKYYKEFGKSHLEDYDRKKFDLFEMYYHEKKTDFKQVIESNFVSGPDYQLIYPKMYKLKQSEYLALLDIETEYVKIELPTEQKFFMYLVSICIGLYQRDYAKVVYHIQKCLQLGYDRKHFGIIICLLERYDIKNATKTQIIKGINCLPDLFVENSKMTSSDESGQDNYIFQMLEHYAQFETNCRKIAKCYLDVSMLTSDVPTFVSCLLWSCYYYCQCYRTTDHAKTKAVCKNIMIHLAINICYISQKYFNTITRFYFNYYLLILLNHTGQYVRGSSVSPTYNKFIRIEEQLLHYLTSNVATMVATEKIILFPLLPVSQTVIINDWAKAIEKIF